MKRRALLAGGTLGLLNPRLLKAAPNSSERKFLFVFCSGGWDQCYSFAPLWGERDIDMEPNSQLGQVNGIDFVDSMAKPSMRLFFEQFGNQSCLINGIESRSVAHEACLRLMFSGSTSTQSNDWPTMIAASAQDNHMMPLVTLSGPSFVHDLGSSVVRIGENGQLGSLLDPTAFTHSINIDELEDQWLNQANLMRDFGKGIGEELLDLSIRSESVLQDIQNLRHTVNLVGGEAFESDLSLARTLLSSNSSRCVSIGHFGWQNLGWDTHAANQLQTFNFEELFNGLYHFLDDTQREAPSLYENLTVVVLSEMGRFPKLNFRQGKTHWTHGSALLIGSGIRGGQVIGAYDKHCLSQAVSLQSGALSSNGTYLLPGHIGATLMELANAESGPQLEGYGAIKAALL